MNLTTTQHNVQCTIKYETENSEIKYGCVEGVLHSKKKRRIKKRGIFFPFHWQYEPFKTIAESRTVFLPPLLIFLL